MSNQQIPLGNILGWFLARFTMVAVMMGLIFIVFFSGCPPGAIVLFFPFLLFYLFFEWKFPFAYGYANDEGICFRRWMRWHSAKWNEIKDIEWRSARFLGYGLFLKKAPGRPNKILLQNSSLSGLLDPSTDNIPWIEYQIKNASEKSP